MLRVFLDRGEKTSTDDGVVTVAGVVFRREPYRNFCRVWNPMLKRWNATAFHATDFYSGYGDFFRFNEDGSPHLERTEWFKRDCLAVPTIIGANASRLVAIGFRPDEFRRVASDAFKAAYGTSVHSLATQILLLVNGWWAKEVGYDGKFACFMESGDDEEAEVVSTVARMKVHHSTASHVRVASFTPIGKGTSRGLEAADFFAWHWNKYYMDRYRQAGTDVQARKDLAAMMQAAEEGNVYASLIVGDKLTYFLSGATLPDGASPLAEGFSAPTIRPADLL
jgi:hypothetical protein